MKTKQKLFFLNNTFKPPQKPKKVIKAYQSELKSITLC